MPARNQRRGGARRNSRTPRQPNRPERGPPPPRPGPARRTGFALDDEAVEIALQTGEHRGLLEDYFGVDNYRELQELAKECASRAVRGGAKVLILPGIMGSKIGTKSKIASIFDDVYWFDPIDVFAGKLAQLKLGSVPSKYRALGVILFAYLSLKLRLRIWGFDADFHPFDWRQSIATLGQELKARLKREGSGTVSLVCHSMGGLVARWALGNGAKCRRLIMLGTPNFGSFVPVMALRGTHPLVRKVAFIDPWHSAEDLASEVFSTFPGLTEMFPSPEKFDDLNLYDLDQWPDDNLRPRRNILQRVRTVQAALARADNRFSLIAGVNRKTAVNVALEGSGFSYEFTHEGDGTVPLAFAELKGAVTYYVEEGHGSLPNNRTVARAVRDILHKGRTDLLPEQWTPPSVRAVDAKTDDELRVNPYGDRREAALSQRENRTVLKEVVAPSAGELPRPEASFAPPPEEALVGGRGYEHRFDRVVVGRRRQHRLDLRFAFGSITEVTARAIGLGIFRDVSPGGAATAIDKELNGAVTELTRRRMFSGNVGEIFMLPTGRHRIATEFIAFVGLGAFDRFNDDALQIAAENLVRTFVSARVEEFATVLMGVGSGGSTASSLRAQLTGFLRGLQDADTDHQFRRVIICERDRARYDELKAEIYRVSSTRLCEDVEITFDEMQLPAPRPIVEPLDRKIARTATAYLIVRQERRSNNEIDIRSSVLTAGAKATVVTGIQTVRESDLGALLDQVADHKGADFSSIGQNLARLALAREVRQVLPSQKKRHLVVVHDAPLSRIPWETLALSASTVWHPASERGLSHLYAAENLSVAKWLEQRIRDAVFKVLLIVNPTGDLAGAVAEGRALRELVKATPGARVDELRGDDATRIAVLDAFGTGKYDVIHYAGHAFFDARNPERSGIHCSDMPLTGADLAGLRNLPTLVFFNACESSRVRKTEALKPTTRRRKFRESVKEGVGLAEAFMRGGVANFVGTYWPVADRPAEEFAKAFYTELLRGRTMNEAVQAGRGKVRDLDSKDWANYVHYGNPDFVVKEKRSE